MNLFILSLLLFLSGTVVVVMAFDTENAQKNLLRYGVSLLTVSLLIFIYAVTLSLIELQELLDLIGA